VLANALGNALIKFRMNASTVFTSAVNVSQVVPAVQPRNRSMASAILAYFGDAPVLMIQSHAVPVASRISDTPRPRIGGRL